MATMVRNGPFRMDSCDALFAKSLPDLSHFRRSPPSSRFKALPHDGLYPIKETIRGQEKPASPDE